MKIKIQIYKGHQIAYNEDSDKFECDIEIDNNIKKSKRGSLKDIKKEIDQFIKINIEFKPFKFLRKSSYGSKSFEACSCSAIRTDGKFVVNEEGSNRNSYYDKKDMQLAMKYDIDIVKEALLSVKELEQANKKHKDTISLLFDKLVPIDLSAYENISTD